MAERPLKWPGGSGFNSSIKGLIKFHSLICTYLCNLPEETIDSVVPYLRSCFVQAGTCSLSVPALQNHKPTLTCGAQRTCVKAWEHRAQKGLNPHILFYSYIDLQKRWGMEFIFHNGILKESCQLKLRALSPSYVLFNLSSFVAVRSNTAFPNIVVIHALLVFFTCQLVYK
jgi:hypothetical protein